MKAKKGQLKVKWGNTSNNTTKQVVFSYGEGVSSSDNALMILALSPLIEELEERGYDLTTLKFSIKQKEVE